MKVSQPTPNPTNKLTAAMIGVFGIEVLKLLVKNFAPDFYEEGLWIAASPIAVIVAGYFIKDDANTASPVVVSTPATESANGPA